MYTLTNKVLAVIDSMRPVIINDLASHMKCSYPTMNKYLRENLPDGELTKTSVVEFLVQKTGLKKEDILAGNKQTAMIEQN